MEGLYEFAYSLWINIYINQPTCESVGLLHCVVHKKIVKMYSFWCIHSIVEFQKEFSVIPQFKLEIISLFFIKWQHLKKKIIIIIFQGIIDTIISFTSSKFDITIEPFYEWLVLYLTSNCAEERRP